MEFMKLYIRQPITSIETSEFVNIYHFFPKINLDNLKLIKFPRPFISNVQRDVNNLLLEKLFFTE